MSLIELAREELLRSNVDKKHPFKLLTLATFGVDYPETRTVVKRHVDADFNVLVYTDSRTPKVFQAQENSNVSVLFYNPKKRLQVRIKAFCCIVDSSDQSYFEHLHRIKSSGNTKDYQTKLAPGSEVTNEVLYDMELNFSLIKLIARELDILQLGKEQHLRAKSTKQNNLWL